MVEGKIVIAKEGPIGWLLFDNPKKYNAVSYEMWRSLPEQLACLADDPDIRVLVLRGEGEKAFISGADISQFEAKRSAAADLSAYDETTQLANHAILSCSKPTLAMIQGYCLGGGLGVALCCDLRFCSDSAHFAIPAAKLGLGYPYDGIKRLADVVGPSAAKEIFYTGRQFTAIEASAMGLVNRSFADASLRHSVTEIASQIARNAPSTISAAKLAIECAMSDAGGKNHAAIDGAVAACFASDDYREGQRAFIEKRQPHFQGR